MHFNQAPVLEPAASIAKTTASLPITIEAGERAQLMRICQRVTRDRDTAEDLAQETLLEAWRNWQKLRDAHDPQARMRWLAAIASHICRRWARTHGHDLRRMTRLDTAITTPASVNIQPGTLAELLASDDTIDAALERAERVELLERALSLVPRETRDMLVSRYLSETPPREIAARYGLTEATLSVRLHRGRQALHQVLSTTLREDAVAHGLIEQAAELWQVTRIWCPTCGQTRLKGRLGGTPVHLQLYCTRCDDTSAPFVDHKSHLGILDDLKSFKAALNRVMVWADPYYRHGIATGNVLCVRCGRPAPLLVGRGHETRGGARGELGVHMECSCNAINNSDLAGMALFTPEGQSFWRTHPRIHQTPTRYVETSGRDAVVIGYQSVTGSATFDALYARETFELLATNKTPGT